MSPDEGQEELEEVQAELKKKDEEVSHSTIDLDQKGTQLGINTPEVSQWPHLCDIRGLHQNNIFCLVLFLYLSVI